MTTQFATTTDGFQIAYDLQGTGPALLLVHGFSNNRTLWQQHGWVEQLQHGYTVITVDLRGCGESTATTEPTDYTHTAHLADIEAVLDACDLSTGAGLWGEPLAPTSLHRPTE